MNLTKVILSLSGILFVIYFSIVSFQTEIMERELRKSDKIVYAKILELNCGRRDNIKFQYQDKRISKRIYLSDDECNELAGKTQIGLKVNLEGNIVFAIDSYNDWAEAELLSIILLGSILSFCILYYGILLELKKNRM